MEVNEEQAEISFVGGRSSSLFPEEKDLPKTPRRSWADRGTDRNRRATNHRSHLSLVPLDKLFPGRNDIFVYTHPTDEPTHEQRRSGPDDLHWKIPVSKWPAVLRRVAQGETYRQIASHCGVSYEAVRRVVKLARREKR